MIRSSNRFHGRGSLQYLYKRGKVVRSQLLSIKYVANRRRTDYRLAVVVSRKISKSAVVRNRIRRRVYEIIRRHAAHLNGAYDLAVFAYSDQLAEMPAKELEKLVLALLYKAGVLQKNSPAAPRPVGSHAIVKGKEHEE